MAETDPLLKNFPPVGFLATPPDVGVIDRCDWEPAGTWKLPELLCMGWRWVKLGAASGSPLADIACG